MLLYCRARRCGLLVGAILFLALALVLLRGRALLVPTVVGGGVAPLAWSTLLPLAWAAVVCAAFEGVGHQVEWRPGRRLHLLDAGIFLCGAAALTAALSLAASSEVFAALVAHALLVSGLATVVTVVRDAATGMLVMTALFLATTSYNPRLPGAAYVRVLQPEGDVVFSLVVALALTALAVVALLMPRAASTAAFAD